jgi:hypothetical protein
MSRLTKNDNKIQELLERGLKPENYQGSIDLFVYQTVFENLNKKPTAGLPLNFASKVVSEIRTRQSLQFVFRRQASVLVFFAVAALAFYFGISVVKSDIASLLLHFAFSNKWIACFGISCYLVVEYLNYRVVRR